MKLEVFPLSLATPVPEVMDEVTISRLTVLLGGAFEMGVEVAQHSEDGWIVLGPRRASVHPEEVQPAVRRAWDRLSADTHAVVIDLRAADDNLRAGTMDQFARSLNEVMAGPDGPNQLVVIAETIRSRRNLFRLGLESNLAPGSVVHIEAKGRVEFSGPQPVSPGASVQVSNEVQLAEEQLEFFRSDPTFDELMVELNNRIVRRRGFFPDPKTSPPAFFRRFYYELGLADSQLESLILLQLRALSPASTRTAVFLGDGGGLPDWLSLPLAAACQAADAEFYFLAEGIDATDLGQVDLAIGFTQFVDTGEGLQRVYDRLVELAPGAVVEVCTILANEGYGTASTDQPGVWPSAQRTGQPGFSYLAAVPQRRILATERLVVDVGFVPDSYEQESFGTIATYDFWEMVSDAGTVELERDHSTGRDPLRLVPRFEGFFQSDGPWLASKARLILRSNGIVPSDAVFVAPKNEAGSAAFAEALEQTIAVSTIRIPKKQILRAQELHDRGEDLPIDEWASSEWFARLRTSSHHNPLVALDEFVVSRRSLRGIAAIVSSVGGTLADAIVLADFEPRSTAAAPKIWPLYQFEHSVPATIGPADA